MAGKFGYGSPVPSHVLPEFLLYAVLFSISIGSDSSAYVYGRLIGRAGREILWLDEIATVTEFAKGESQ